MNEGDQNQNDGAGNVVQHIVNFRKEEIQLAYIAPYQADDHTHKDLAKGYAHRQNDGRACRVPYLAPIVAAHVIRAEPELGIG